MTNIERMELLGHALPPVLMLAAAGILLQNQILRGFSTGNPTDVLFVLAGVVLGSAGIEKLLELRGSVDTRRRLSSIESKLDRLGQAEILIGEVEIQAAALDLIASCSPRSFVKATAQYVFTGGLDDSYYKLIRAKMDEADALGVGFFYHVVVAEQDNERASKRREPFFKDHLGRYKLASRGRQQWPFDVLIGGGRMILAVSGQSGKSHNVGFYIKDSETAAAADQWFEEVIWDSSTPRNNNSHNPTTGADADAPLS